MKTLVSGGKRQSRNGKGQKEGWNNQQKEYVMLAKQQELGKDLGKCGFKISQGNNDRTATKQEHVVSIQEGTSRCRAALLDLAEGSSSADSVDKNSALWEPVIPEGTTWDYRKNSKVVRDAAYTRDSPCAAGQRENSDHPVSRLRKRVLADSYVCRLSSGGGTFVSLDSL